MNSTKTTTLYLIASILAFALFANVSAPTAVFATGGLDDEEEEAAIEELQSAVEEIKDAIGTIELNLTEGTNHIDANCPSTEEIVQEVVENITAEEPKCPFVVEQPPPQQNVTEVIEEIIENVTEVITPPTEEPPATCPFVPKEIIPDIVLPNITEPTVPVEPPECPQQPPVPVEPEPECPPSVVTNTTNNNGNGNGNNLTDGQEIATIEFDASCSCFVVDKTPAEVVE